MCRPTLCGADAYTCALTYRALPAKVLVVRAGLASGGGWARLTPTIGRHEDENQMNYKTEIHPAKNLSSERRSELAQWFEEEFGHIPFQWASPSWYVLALSDSTLIGRLGIIERKASVNGKLLEVAGVSGVITRSEIKGNGVLEIGKK